MEGVTQTGERRKRGNRRGHTLLWEGGKKISVSGETQGLENFISILQERREKEGAGDTKEQKKGVSGLVIWCDTEIDGHLSRQINLQSWSENQMEMQS